MSVRGDGQASCHPSVLMTKMRAEEDGILPLIGMEIGANDVLSSLVIGKPGSIKFLQQKISRELV